MSAEVKEMDRLSQQLKEKATELQKKIEDAGGEHLKNQKAKVTKIQSHSAALNDAKNEYRTLKKTVDQLRGCTLQITIYKDLEHKGKGHEKIFDDLLIALSEHIEQIEKDLVDPEKLQTTLRDGTLGETCDLKTDLEMVAILEAQLKEMNPNLDSISEYRNKVSVHNERFQELNSVNQERDDIKKQYDER
ncbi:Structural maintenance of chromosomes protein 4 [Datura stramonium]|uniref:Structural maintenance of chromosomes protein 4 n=1 Tax=Datura stramonium TaxID=4076 RepID=A0ABS8SUK1_DATST|nr:Structural maintenance of chromosomes protein 4 [Datura stramonium]